MVILLVPLQWGPWRGVTWMWSYPSTAIYVSGVQIFSYQVLTTYKELETILLWCHLQVYSHLLFVYGSFLYHKMYLEKSYGDVLEAFDVLEVASS